MTSVKVTFNGEPVGYDRNLLGQFVSKREVRCRNCHDKNCLIECKCGCNHIVTLLDKKGRERQYIKGHSSFKDEIKYDALHERVRKNLPKPVDGKCEICGQAKPLDLSNKTGIYDEDLSNWQYLCKSCHKTFDSKFGIGPNGGRSMSTETRSKIMMTLKGRKLSEEHKMNIAIASEKRRLDPKIGRLL
jgi:hypothetical protein